MKKVAAGLTIALLATLVVTAWARMEQVPKNKDSIQALTEDVAEVKQEIRGLRDAVDQGNRSVVLELRKLGKSMKKEKEVE